VARGARLSGAYRAFVLVVLVLAGCAVSAGGFSLSFLQDASVTLNTGTHDGDPNAP